MTDTTAGEAAIMLRHFANRLSAMDAAYHFADARYKGAVVEHLMAQELRDIAAAVNSGFSALLERV